MFLAAVVAVSTIGCAGDSITDNGFVRPEHQVVPRSFDDEYSDEFKDKLADELLPIMGPDNDPVGACPRDIPTRGCSAILTIMFDHRELSDKLNAAHEAIDNLR